MAETTIHGIKFQVVGETDNAIRSLERLESTLKRLKSVSAGGKIGVGGIATGLKGADKSIKRTTSLLGKLGASIKRIMFYRMIRSALKAITEGFREGLENAYHFSQITGYELANSLDRLASASLKMKNQMGAAFGELIMTVEPVLLQLISLVTRAANALAQLFAALGGRSTYLKAVDTMTTFGEAVGGVGAAAKEAMEYLAPFDELNVLPDDKAGGGGGGANVPDYSEMFEETPVAQRIKEFATSLKLAFNDVLIDWKDLTWEQIAEKIVSGLITLAAFGAGLTLTGSLAGGLTFGLVGLGLSLVLNTFYFNHDGVLDKEELRKTLELAAGAGIGFLIGGPGGALFTMSIVVALQMALGNSSLTSWLVQNIINPIKRQWNEFVDSNPRVCELFGWTKFDGLGPAGHSSTSATSTVILKVELDKEDSSFWSLVEETGGQHTEGIFSEDSVIAKKAREFGAWLGRKVREGFGIKTGYALDTETFGIDAEVNVTGINDKIPIKDKIINGIKAIFGFGKDEIPQSDKKVTGVKAVYGTNSDAIPIGQKFINGIKAIFSTRQDNLTADKKTFNTKARFVTGSIASTFARWIKMGAKFTQGKPGETLKRWITMGAKFIDKTVDRSRFGYYIDMVAKFVYGLFNGKRVAGGGVFANGMWHNVAQYASGGTPRNAQLFMAREAGPELVGTIGSHTAVMNNNQIVESVASGVQRAIAGIRFQMTGFSAASIPDAGGMDEDMMYRALLRALNDSDVFPDEISLDGAAVYRKMVQRNRQERARTGVNPMMAS